MRTHSRNGVVIALFLATPLMATSAGAADEQAGQTWTDECQVTMGELFAEMQLVRHDQEQYRLVLRSGRTSAAALNAIRVTLDRMDAQIVQAKRQCGPREPMLRKVRGFAKDRRIWLRSRPKS